MLRTIVIAAAVLVLLIAAGGGMLYLAYGLSDAPPRVQSVAGLDDSTAVAAFRNGAGSIRARSRSDAYTALGFLHARQHGWSMTLWQRTARGRLSPWFGDELLPLDRLTRRLGLARLAAASYRRLSADEREVLEAYARGVNAGFDDTHTAHAAEFSALELAPDRWEPWYALAVERLFAWLATDPPPPDSLRAAPEGLRDFYEADRLLRAWLHVHSFDHGMAWTLRDSLGTRLTQRHVYGASALPIFQEVEISIEGGGSVSGATLIGTPFMPAGRSETTAWAILLSGDADVEVGVRDTSASRLVHERLETAEGVEFLLRFREDDGGVFFEAVAPRAPAGSPEGADTFAIPPDTFSTPSGMAYGHTLRWPGLAPGSDAGAWLALVGDEAAAFHLFRGDGLAMDRDGTTRVLGAPRLVYEHAGGVAVGNSPWTRYAAERLDSLRDDDLPGASGSTLLDDVHSTWAERIAPVLSNSAVAVPDQSALVIDALAYLRNWDFRYDRASIAASIFDSWAEVHRDSLGALPDPSVPDTALGMHLVRYELLVEAVRHLADRFGENPSQWRWEEVQRHRYLFPVWSADSLLGDGVRLKSRSRYAPVTLPGTGHVTSLRHGPSRIAAGPDAPATWEGWVSTREWDAFRYRRRRFEANRFFGRYLVSDRIPDPQALPTTERTTFDSTLIPE